MRRILVIGACLIGLGWLVWLLWRQSAATEGVPLDADAVIIPGREPGVGVAVEVEPGSFSAVTVVDNLSSDEWDGPGRVSAPESPVDLDEARADVQGVAPESHRRSEQSGTAVGDREQILAELAQIRADVVERVERRPLFVMAEQHGVPHFRLLSMTKQELFEAVLEAEGLPPNDVMPSLQSAERIKEIADEALRLHEKIQAEETAHLANNKTA
jgi:hypothetical protein